MIALRCPNCGPDARADLDGENIATCAAVVTGWSGARPITRPGCGLTLRLCRAHGLRTVSEAGPQTRCECGLQTAPRVEEAAKVA